MTISVEYCKINEKYKNKNKENKMKDKKKYIYSIVFFVILFVLTYWAIFKDNSITEIIEVFKDVNVLYIIIAFGLAGIFLVTNGIYMKKILKYLGYKISLWKGFVYSCIEFYFSGITPSSTGGQPAQMYYMRKDKVPLSASSIAVLLITAIYKLVLIVLGIFALIFNAKLIISNGTVFNIIFAFGMLMNFLIIFGCMFLMFSKKLVKKISKKIIKLLAKLRISKSPEKLLEKIERHLEDYAKGAKYIKENMGLSVKVFLLTLIQRVSMFSIGYFVYRAFGQSTYGYFDIMFIQVAIALAIDSLPFPGGIGISEVMLTMIYTKIFGEELGLPAMLLTRIVSYYFILLVSGITTMVNHINVMKKENKNKKNKEKKEDKEIIEESKEKIEEEI